MLAACLRLDIPLIHADCQLVVSVVLAGAHQDKSLVLALSILLQFLLCLGQEHGLPPLIIPYREKTQINHYVFAAVRYCVFRSPRNGVAAPATP